MKEAGWRAEEEQPPPYRLLLDRVPQPVGPVPLSRFMQSALAWLMTDEDAWPFLDPVSAEEVPDYHTIIKVRLKPGSEMLEPSSMPAVWLSSGAWTASGALLNGLPRHLHLPCPESAKHSFISPPGWSSP